MKIGYEWSRDDIRGGRFVETDDGLHLIADIRGTPGTEEPRGFSIVPLRNGTSHDSLMTAEEAAAFLTERNAAPVEVPVAIAPTVRTAFGCLASGCNRVRPLEGRFPQWPEAESIPHPDTFTARRRVRASLMHETLRQGFDTALRGLVSDLAGNGEKQGALVELRDLLEGIGTPVEGSSLRVSEIRKRDGNGSEDPMELTVERSDDPIRSVRLRGPQAEAVCRGLAGLGFKPLSS